MKTNTLPFDINSTLFASLVGSYHSKSNQIPSTPLSPQTLQLLRKEIRKLKEDAEQRIMVMQSNTLLVKEWIASSTSSSSVSSSLSTPSSATINDPLRQKKKDVIIDSLFLTQQEQLKTHSITSTTPLPISSQPIPLLPTLSISLSSSLLPFSSLPVSSLPVSSLPVSSLPVSSLPVSSLPVSSLPVSSLPVSSLPFSSPPVSSLPVSSLPVSSLHVSSLPVSPLVVTSASYSLKSKLKHPSSSLVKQPYSKPATSKPSKKASYLKEKRKSAAHDTTTSAFNESPIIEGDYSTVKVTNQVPFPQFSAFMDQFFRLITEEDIHYISQKGDSVTPFMTPHLGKHYALQWAQEDGANMDISDSDALMTKLPSGSEEDYKQIDGAVFPGDIEFGTLWPRLLSALIQDPTSAGSYCLEEGNQYPASPTKFDMAGLEERLRRELRYIGIITDKDVMMDDDHCDEISIDLKKAQKQLRLQMEENDFMKEKLLVVAQEWVGWQEYNALLDDVNKQIEQFYDKKFVHYCR